MPPTTPTPRQFGREISQNARRRPNMKIEERNIAIGMLAGGCTATEVADHFSRAVSTITRLHEKLNTTTSIADKPSSGWPKITSKH